MPLATFQPADGEGPISRSIQRAISDVLGEIEPGKSGAFLTAVTVDGIGRTDITAAAAHRTETGWTVATWLRKDVRDQLEAGVFVKKTW